MVIVDANVLLYSVDDTSAFHVTSRSWLDRALGGREAVGLAWVALLAFLRISTRPAVYPNPLTVAEATNQVDLWLAAPSAVVTEPTVRHAAVLRGLLIESGTAGNRTTDAHLAALAIEYGGEIVSYDRDFGRYPGVRHRLPG